MDNRRPSPERREIFVHPGPQAPAAAFLLVRGGRRESEPETDPFSRKLTLERPFVSAPTD